MGDRGRKGKRKGKRKEGVGDLRTAEGKGEGKKKRKDQDFVVIQLLLIFSL